MPRTGEPLASQGTRQGTPFRNLCFLKFLSYTEHGPWQRTQTLVVQGHSTIREAIRMKYLWVYPDLATIIYRISKELKNSIIVEDSCCE